MIVSRVSRSGRYRLSVASHAAADQRGRVSTLKKQTANVGGPRGPGMFDVHQAAKRRRFRERAPGALSIARPVARL